MNGDQIMGLVLFLGAVVLVVVIGVRAAKNGHTMGCKTYKGDGMQVGVQSANHGYTMGSGLFKKSEANLEKEAHLDVSDYDYYNSKDVMG
jgi:hypothetical protein